MGNERGNFQYRKLSANKRQPGKRQIPQLIGDEAPSLQMNTRLSNFCNKAIEAGCVLCLALVPLTLNIFAEQPGRIFEGSKVFLLRSTTLVMALAWLVAQIEVQKTGPRKAEITHPLILLTALLAILYLVSTFLSPYFPISLRGYYLRDEGFYTFICYICIFFLVATELKHESQIDNLNCRYFAISHQLLWNIATLWNRCGSTQPCEP